MNKNDKFFKILFAIQLAFIPLLFGANILLPSWSISLFIAGILIVKIWLELFKDKNSKTHYILNALASIAVVSALTMMFYVKGNLHLAMAIVAISLVILHSVFKFFTFNNQMPELISAVDSCFMMFECLVIGTFTFIMYYSLTANISLFALMLTAVVSVLYRIYYLFKYKKAVVSTSKSSKRNKR